jgi:hypothetical protein
MKKAYLLVLDLAEVSQPKMDLGSDMKPDSLVKNILLPMYSGKRKNSHMGQLARKGFEGPYLYLLCSKAVET